MIYLTAIGMLPGGSSTVHIYTQTIHTTTQRKNYFGRVWTVPRLCEFYPGICLTTDEKARKTSVRVGDTIYFHQPIVSIKHTKWRHDLCFRLETDKE